MSGGAWIFLVSVMLLFLAVVCSFSTSRGSGVNQRPHDKPKGDAAGGAVGRDRIASAENETEGVPYTHGTK